VRRGGPGAGDPPRVAGRRGAARSVRTRPGRSRAARRRSRPVRLVPDHDRPGRSAARRPTDGGRSVRRAIRPPGTSRRDAGRRAEVHPGRPGSRHPGSHRRDCRHPGSRRLDCRRHGAGRRSGPGRGTRRRGGGRAADPSADPVAVPSADPTDRANRREDPGRDGLHPCHRRRGEAWGAARRRAGDRRQPPAVTTSRQR
jgi:hypothetical protein